VCVAPPLPILARSTCDEAIQRFASPSVIAGGLDCFAEPVIGRRFAPTRWLARRRDTRCLEHAMTARDARPKHPPKEKGPTFVGPVWGLTPLRTGPIPKAPGGWGLRNPEPKGPGQRSALLFAKPHGVGLAEVGHHCDPANDPVTTKSAPELIHLRDGPSCSGAQSARSWWRGVILQRGSRFSEKIMPWMTGGVAWM
jgi:hypothetical protein